MMNAQQQGSHAVGHGPLDLLISAMTASGSGNTGAGQQQSQFMQSLQGGQPLNTHIQQPSDPNATALSLDQMFGHSNFSRALSTAQSTAPSQLTTPFYEHLLNSTQPASTSFQGAGMPATPIQQTRSGRISRPPVALAQNDLMRVLTLLNQPGMEPVRAAMETTGMFEGFAPQPQAGQSEADQRERAVGQALQALLDAQAQGRQAAQPQPRPQAQAPSKGTSAPKVVAEVASKKRARPTKNDEPTPPSLRQMETTASPDVVSPAYSTQTSGPSKGKGSRLAMTKAEAAARRKERNKASAYASRQKKQTALEVAQEALKEKEEEVRELSERCERLERELEDMRQVIHSSGIHLPGRHTFSAEPTPPPIGLHQTSVNPNMSTLPQSNGAGPSHSAPSHAGPSQPPSNSFPAPAPEPTSNNFPFPLNFNCPTLPDPTFNLFSTDGSMNFDSGLDAGFDFNMFMNMDSMEDEEADGDFEPETSPHRGSDTDGEREGVDGEDEDEENTPMAKRQKRRGSSQDLPDHGGADAGQPELDDPLDQETPAESNRGAGDEEFIDPEMEDEDLFLPIEDVPIPPSSGPASASLGSGTGAMGGDGTGDMMKALKVDTRDQLAAVMQKLVDSAGEGGLVGVPPEVVDKLKNVIMMAQTQARAKEARAEERRRAAEGSGTGAEEESSGSGSEGESSSGE